MSENGSSKVSLLERFVPILLVLSVALAFVVGVLWQKVNSSEKTGGTTLTEKTDGNQQPKVQVSLDQIKSAFDKAVVKFGKSDAKIVFIEAADPSCPFCHIAAGKNSELAKQVGDRFTYISDGGTYIPPVPEMKKLVDQGKASYAFIYRNGHGNGEMGTKALYCAQDQGKFWQVHDKIYSNAGYDLLNKTVLNDKTKSKELTDFLKEVVDATKLRECIDSGKYDSKLAEDEKVAGDLGITGTPGYYINTKNFEGAYSWNDMKSSL